MLSVREVAEKFSVTPQTVRSWDRKGIIRAARVSPTGRRYYDEKEIEKVWRGGTSDGSIEN